jgi:WD40 repeat protein/serine/threonine protein kinase
MAEKPSEQSIFLHALGLASLADRAAYLEDVCRDNPQLRLELDALLAAHNRLGADPPLGGLDIPRTIDAAITERPGTIIGPYKLLQQIGEGGFGVVFMAEQQEPVRRKVALKVLKPGMDTRQVVARFEAERQALAIMDHPNIAKVFDGGATPSGRPYFVMELVKGVSITQFCDEQRLSPRQRLELFIPVCQAVQHAHQKGIIHRDLKPSNVLVSKHDTTPVVKVIDFGVAKALGQELTDKTLFTEIAQMIGTPLYMSPEQAGMSDLDIDTRSDIYSLGVLLYELLTGSTPFTKDRFKKAAYDEIRRIIREEEPPKPSTRLSNSKDSLPSISAQRQMEPVKLTKLVRGELDWIVMKALEKDRNRRYDTANSFAVDVQRYLNDETVQACPPSAGYRFRKFAWRNKWAFVTASAAAMVVLLALIGLAVSNVLISQEKDKKVAALNQAEINEAAAITQKILAQENAAKADAQRQIAVEQGRLAKEAELAARRRLYDSHMNLAYESWKKGQTARVPVLLETHRPQTGQEDLRSFEWYFLWQLYHRGERKVLRGHRAAVLSVAFAPDGKTLTSGDSSGDVRLWDVTAGKERLALPPQAGRIWCVAYSPDGKMLVSASYEVGLKLWDPETGKEQGELERGGGWTSLAFGSDGTTLATGSMDGLVRLWDTKTRRERAVLRGMPEPSWVNVALSPDGKRMAATNAWSSTPRTLLWDLTADPPRVTYRLPGAVSAAFSPDSQTVVLAGDGRLTFVDAATGKEKLTHRIDTGYIKGVAFSPDGRTLAYGSDDQTVRLWNYATGQKRTYAQAGRINSVAFSPDGTMVASASEDETVRLWDVKWEPDAVSLPRVEAVTVLAFSPDGRTLACGSSDTVRLWNLIEGREIARLKLSTGKVRAALTFSHDGNTLAVAGGHTIKLFDTARWQAKATLVTPASMLVSGDRTMANPPPPGNPPNVWNLSFSPDDRTLAAGDSFNEVKLWDLASGKVRFTVMGYAIAFSPDGRLLAASWGPPVKGRIPPGRLKLVDVATGRDRLTLWNGDHSMVASVAFSPDGTTVAQATRGQVFLWDARTGTLRTILKGHTASSSWSVAFHPDGKILASTNKDGSISLWDVATGQERIVLTGHTDAVNFVAFSPDGTTLASAGEDGFVKIWRAPQADQARASNTEFDPLAVPPLIGDMSRFAQQLEQVRKALEHHPDRSSEMRPKLAHSYFDLGVLFMDAKRYPEAMEAYRKFMELAPRSGLADLNKAIELSQDNVLFHYWHALVRLGVGDLAGYRSDCAVMLERFRQSNEAELCHWAAWATVLAPDAVKDLDGSVKMAEMALRNDPQNVDFSNTLGAALYRAGRFTEAIQRLSQVTSEPGRNCLAYPWFFLAMAHHRVGHSEEARKW